MAQFVFWTGIPPVSGATNVNGSDTGTGVDAVTAKSSTALDTGAGVDSASAKSSTAADTGTGVEATSLATALTTADTAVGVDSVTAKSSTAFDTAVGVDAATDKTTTVADTGTGAESTSLTTALSTADTGTGVDFGTVTVPVTGTDTGTGVESTSLTTALTAADTGTGVEATSLATALSTADTGTGVDSITAKSSTAFDTGTGVDATVSIGLSTADTGVGTDAVSAKSSTAGDVGTGVDGVTNTGLSGTDTGTAVDSITAKSSTAFDTGLGVEGTSLNTGNSFNVSDTGVGVEDITARQITAFDTGVGVDAAGRSATAGDIGTGVDAISVKSAVVADGGSANSSTRNRMPDYNTWTLSGGAFINGNGELEIPVGGQALSPLIPINQEDSWCFSADYFNATQSNYVPFQPDAARLLTSAYYGADGVTPAINRGGYTANGSAVQFTTGAWTDRIPVWAYYGGIGCHYLQMTVINEVTYGGGTLLSRNPMLSVGSDNYSAPFVAFTAGDAITAKSSTAFDTGVGVEGQSLVIAGTSFNVADTAVAIDLASVHIVSKWYFTPPAVRAGKNSVRAEIREPRDRFNQYLDRATRSVSVVIIDGVAVRKSNPSSNYDPDSVFLGGHVHELAEDDPRLAILAQSYGAPDLVSVPVP